MKQLVKLFSKKEQLAGILGVLFTAIFVGYISLQWQHSIEYDEAKAEADNHVAQIYDSISDISEVTASLRTLYRVSLDFGSDELEQYTSDLIDVSDRIGTIGRFDRILQDEVSAYASLMSERGVYRFTLKSLNDDGSTSPLNDAREVHSAVVSINPFTPAVARLIGVDLSEVLAEGIAQSAVSNESELVSYPRGWPKTADSLLLIPTYAGRYTPETAESRAAQTDGGYFLELSLAGLLTSSDNLYSEVSFSEQILRSAVANGDSRFFEGIFIGYHTELSPRVGRSVISISIDALDGVSFPAVLRAVFWMAIVVALAVVVLILIAGSRVSEYQRRSAQRSLESERKIALATLETINDSVFTLNASGEISYVNPAGEAMINKGSDVIIGSDIKSAIPFADEKSCSDGVREIESKLITGEPATLCDLDLSVSDNKTQVDCAFTPFTHADEANGGVLVMRDVGQERVLNRKLEHLATHDTLTGLVNRYYFELKLEEMIEGANKHGESHGICYIDMDQFKIVNDTCGHSAGDRLLVKLADYLKKIVRPDDVLARLGGDEFGLLIRNCDESGCEAIAREIYDEMQKFYFSSEEHRFAIRACIGFVMIDESSENISDVMAAADIACYSAKDRGRNELHIFRAECEQTNERQGEMAMLPKLQNALAVDKFVLFVQPIAEVHANGYDDTKKYEILLRMEDEDGSLITPFRLIAAAERYDLMREIDRWVINRALHEIASLKKLYLDQMPTFSINLSGQSVMDSDLINYIREKMLETGAPPESVCFEITETSAMGDMMQAIALLDFLHEIGCSVALDDFGAGECSFGYLKNLPVDYLKVDGQFVKDVDTCDVHMEMLRFVRRVAHILNMKTVAEFVENESIMNVLREMDIDYAQGYHISKPFHIALLRSELEKLQKAA